MIDRMIRCFVNPACSRVMMALWEKGEATAGQLSKALPDIPAASLYRYLKQLAQAQMVGVVSERRVRGAVERVYAARTDMGEEGSRLLREAPGPTLMAMYTQFSMQLAGQFSAYCERRDIDIERDGLSFTVCPVYASAPELQEALKKIGQVLTELVKQPSAPDRKLHSIAVIATPPQEVS